jgi:hypothetical protein
LSWAKAFLKRLKDVTKICFFSGRRVVSADRFKDVEDLPRAPRCPSSCKRAKIPS